MKRAALILLGLALTTAIASAQRTQRPTRSASSLRTRPAASMPTVDEVLERYIKAIGGREALQKLSSRVSKGSFEIESLAGAKGTMEVYEKAPNKEFSIVNITGLGTETQGFDGSIAWTVEIDSGVLREKNGVELAAARRSADFYEELNLKEQFPRMTLKGVQKIGAREAYVLEGAPALGKPETFYFDTRTGLLIRRDSVDEGPGGVQPEQQVYDDYRTVDGVKIPFLIRLSSSGNMFVIRLTEVKHNVAIDDSKFNKPEEQ